MKVTYVQMPSIGDIHTTRIIIDVDSHDLVKHQSTLMPAALSFPPSEGKKMIEDVVLDVMTATWGAPEPPIIHEGELVDDSVKGFLS